MGRISQVPQVPGLDTFRLIARGGLAEVWAAHEQALGRPVAVKVYQRGLPEADRRRFVQEVAVAGRLAAHPGIVTLYFAGVLPDDRPYLVMELCPGGSLRTWLTPEHRPGEEQVRKVGLSVADTLAAAHAADVLHRDVKPGNILLDSDGRPRLADFGSAVMHGTEPAPAGSVWMTPAWAPPEAFRCEPATQAGDVFSLAATLYALLAGAPPRPVGPPSASLEELAELARRPVLPVPGVSPALMRVLLAGLDDDPAARPSAAVFFDRLARVPLHTSRRRSPAVSTASPPVVVAREEPATVAPAPAPDASGRRRSRRAGFAMLAAALVVVVVSSLAWLFREPAAPSAAVPAHPVPAASTSTQETGPASPPARSIQLAASVGSTKAYQAARIDGTYAGGSETLVRVQRWEEGGWLAFPVPAKTDRTGQFTAYVELGQPGRYRLRVLDPASGVASEPVELVVER